MTREMAAKAPSKAPRGRPASQRGLRPPWKKGQSGNPKGKPKGRVSLTRLLREALEANDEEAARELVTTWVRKAKAGHFGYFKEALDRTDGPTKQQAEVTVRKVEVEYVNE